MFTVKQAPPELNMGSPADEKFYISDLEVGKYLWHNGGLYNTTAPGVLNLFVNPLSYGYWETKEAAEKFLQSWLETNKEN